MTDSPALLREALTHLPARELQSLERAYRLAEAAYAGKREVCCSSLIGHVEQIARLMLPLHPDITTLIATLLLNVRDPETIATIEREFGKEVAHIISYVNLLAEPRTGSLSPAYLRKMILVLSEDVRVLIICLHDRWHALQEASSLPQKEQTLLAREIIDVFAPISARLGVYSIKYELESLAFHILYGEDAEEILKKLEAIRRIQGPFLGIAKRTVEKILVTEGIRASVSAREKHPYSIFRKMQRKNLSMMTDLHDLFGLRIIVDSVDDCYHALGIIHRTYRPIMHRVKDYIAFAKPNGYRSLHTTVLGLNVKDPTMPIEVQIRTTSMNEEAEYGIAAHWTYKEHAPSDIEQQDLWKERMQTLRQIPLPEYEGPHQDEETASELNEAMGDRIYVLTPRGDPIELPKGATPLDFAFRIHSDIGLQFKFAKVNGTIVPIDHPLENGDMIEIFRQKDPRPSMHWIRIAQTNEARQKLRSFFRIEGGDRPTPSKPPQKTPQQTNAGKRRKVDHQMKVILPIDARLPYRFAKCCKPDLLSGEGSPITGFATRSGVITIHHQGCRMLRSANRERFVKAHWANAPEE